MNLNFSLLEVGKRVNFERVELHVTLHSISIKGFFFPNKSLIRSIVAQF